MGSPEEEKLGLHPSNINHATPSLTKVEIFDFDAATSLLKHKGICREQKAMLKKYMARATNGNEVSVTYTFGKHWIPSMKGRVFGPGLQGFWGDLRNALAMKYYEDIDMKNAHPVILENTCKQHGWGCQYLSEYVSDRDRILVEIRDHYKVDLADAKNLIIRMLYLGEVQPWMTDNEISRGTTELPFLRAFGEEIKHIANSVCLFAVDIRKVAERKVKQTKVVSTTLAVFLQTREHAILMCMVAYLESIGRSVGPLIFDGCMVLLDQHDEGLSDANLRDCEIYVLGCVGIKIDLVKKPMVTTLRFGDSDETRLIVGADTPVTDEYAASQFVKLMGSHLVSDNGVVHIFCDTTGLWRKDVESIRKAVVKHKAKMVFYQASEDSKSMKRFNYGGNDRNFKSMMNWVGTHCSIENFFLDRVATSQGKLMFSDGIYDFITNQFKPGFDSSIVFHGRINRPFPKVRDIALINTVTKALFVDPFNIDDMPMSDYLRIGISRAIFGDFRAKLIWFCVGKANAGKGVLTDALKASFETFVGSFNADELVHNDRNGADTAKRLAWVVPICNKRLVYSNEIQMSRPIDGNILKKVASGGDAIEARTNFVDAYPIVCRSTLFCFLNDLPTVNPYDEAAKNRIRVAEYKKVFVDMTNYTGEVTSKIVPADPTLRDKFQTQVGYKDAMIFIIIDSYQEFMLFGHNVPLAVTLSTESWTGSVGSLQAILKERYEITLDQSDFVASQEIDNYLKSTKLGMSKPKVNQELKELKLVEDKQRVHGYTNPVKIWRGIKDLDDM